MLQRTDIFMLSALVVIALSSGWVQYQKQVTPSVNPVVVQEIVSDDELISSFIPDFSIYADVRAKKEAFFGFMMPMIEQENERILALRARIIHAQNNLQTSESERLWLLELGDRYRMKNFDEISESFFSELLIRVDFIPPSLALVQSANESAWGTSRFALQGNNFFGQWCFSKGCGIVPGARPEGKTYEVQKFDDVAESVRSYMHNLNTNIQYQSLRELRQSRRSTGQKITGPVLAQGLYGYSIRGIDYVEELVSMIASNDLIKYDLSPEPVSETKSDS